MINNDSPVTFTIYQKKNKHYSEHRKKINFNQKFSLGFSVCA